MPTFRSGASGRLRWRLTFFYGGLSIVSGAVLLFITYALLTNVDLPRDEAVRIDQRPVIPPFPPERPLPPGPYGNPAYGSHQDIANLLILSTIALAILALLSIGLGWLIAGRVLRPVRTMTATLRQISARNLHERLAFTGPRSELKDLADTVDGLLGRLETALEGHKRFVANAAHELRTPLTVEHALLEEPLIDQDATVESFRANFERLLAISEQRGRLLESLLTLSGSEHGREHYEPVDLADLIEQVVDNRRPELDRRGLTVELVLAGSTGLQILGDPALIERMVANLLDNAVHYNKSGGWVEIGIRFEPGEAVFFVANSGPVVPRAQVQRLVEPFHRLHRVADDGHHGLGLSIVHAIATAHDATLTVRAQLAGGLLVEVAFGVNATVREGLRASGSATGYGANHEISALARDR